jgi:dTDP-4-dehydrorhamnose 3,5-epimerase
MEVQTLAIPAVKLIVPAVFEDARGSFSETYNARLLADAGIACAFVQDNQSVSLEKGVLRGLHFQSPPHAQAKLVRVVAGSIFDVAVDLRTGSPTYGRHVSAVLSAGNRTQIWVPEGFAHGFCTLEPDTVVLYKVTAHHAPDHDRGVRWDDPTLGITWPVANPILSEKDKRHPGLHELPVYFQEAER